MLISVDEWFGLRFLHLLLEEFRVRGGLILTEDNEGNKEGLNGRRMGADEYVQTGVLPDSSASIRLLTHFRRFGRVPWRSAAVPGRSNFSEV